MARKKTKAVKKSGFFSKVKEKFITFKDLYWQRQIIVRTVSLCAAVLLLVFGAAWGKHHQSDVQMKRAMTVSDIHQDLSFSKTGTEVKLEPQKRNKNMAVIPIQFADSENISFDASDYRVFLKSSDKHPLPSNISASFVIFGSTQEGAIILRGDLEKRPLQVVLRNDKNYSQTTDDGDGTIKIDGKEEDVNYNAVAFTVNPKGENVKKDARITPNMSMPDLFATSLGDRQLDEIKAKRKKGNKELKRSQDKKSELERRINQLNDALGRDKNDFDVNDKAEDQSEYADGIENDTDGDPEKSLDQLDLSSADMETLRNNLINDLGSTKDEIETAKSNLKGVDTEEDQINKEIQSMDNLVSISNDYKVID